MDGTTIASLMVTQVGSFGAAALTILTVVIAIAVGLLVFRFGWNKVRGVAGEERYISWETGAPVGGIFNRSGKVRQHFMRGGKFMKDF